MKKCLKYILKIKNALSIWQMLFLLFAISSMSLFSQVGGITGKVVYSKSGKVRAHTLGDKNFVELGPGKFARWSPDGKKVAIKNKKIIYVIDADGSNRTELVTDAGGDKNCPIEFHPNGNEILFVRKKHVWTVNIHTKTQKVLVDFVKSSGELGMSAEKNRLVFRDGHILRAIDLDTKKHTVFADDHCSAAISPDGNYVTYNDNGEPHHLKVHIRKLNDDCTDSQKYMKVKHDVMPGEIMGDNHHWSNHNEWITCEGDEERNGVPFMINVATKKGYAMVDVDGTKYPDLWVDNSARIEKAASEKQ